MIGTYQFEVREDMRESELVSVFDRILRVMNVEQGSDYAQRVVKMLEALYG